MVATSTGQEPQRAISAKENFIESLWVSSVTKWVLTFGGKIARLMLIFCTLYMSAELYPGLTLPPALNVVVFILLNAALDFGGLGLSQIAKKVRAAGKVEEAEQGEALSEKLINVMIMGLAAVTLENACNLIHWDPDFKIYVGVFWAVVGVVLSIYRVILAVRYGHVLHTLEIALEDHQEQDRNEHDTLLSQIGQLQNDLRSAQQRANDTESRFVDLQKQLENADRRIEKLQSDLEESATKLQNAEKELQSAKRTITTLQNTSPTESKVPGKSRPARSAKVPGNVTSFDQARANKAKVSHEDVLKFKADHPALTNAEVAAHLKISERKVYDALASIKENDSANTEKAQ